VIELEAVEFVLKAPHLLHDLVDHELGISTNVEVSNPKLDGDTQVVDKGLILCYIVRGYEVESDHVMYVNSEG
jgi:hypothetical protein